MKIGIDARLWNETGVGRYIRNLVLELQEIDEKNEYVLFIKKGEKVDIKNKNFKIREVDIHWHSLTEQISFASILNTVNLDLVHFPYFSLPVLYRRPFVVTIHDLIIHHFSTGKASTLPFPLYSLKRFGFGAVFNHAIRRSKRIIVPLDSVKKEILEKYSVEAKKIEVTREGFDPLLVKEGKVTKGIEEQVKKGRYFLYVGNAYPHKNVEFLIRSFIPFQQQHPDLRLILVGKDDYFYKKLRGSISHPSISFLHDVSDSDLRYIYQHAVAFVSASHMEGFGLPPLEAMGTGCIVLLSDISSFKEVCSDTPFYFNPTSEEDLQKSFEKVLALSSTQITSLKEKGKKRADVFSWREMAKKTLQIYESSTGV